MTKIIVSAIIFFVIFGKLFWEAIRGFRDDSSDMLSDDLVTSALIDITSNDQNTLDALENAISVKSIISMDSDEPFPHPKQRAYDLIYYALYEGNGRPRATLIDYKQDCFSTLDEFKRLYEIEGIPWPLHVQAEIDKLAPDMKPGQPIGFVLALLASSASDAGYDILNVNSSSDCFLFFLCKKEFSERWMGSNLGGGSWIESPQWQFREDFNLLGVYVSYPEPPNEDVIRTV